MKTFSPSPSLFLSLSLSLILLLTTGCKKQTIDSVLPQDFTVTITYVQSSRADIAILPPSESTCFVVDCMPCDTFHSRYASDADYIRQADSIARIVNNGDLSQYVMQGSYVWTQRFASNTAYYLLLFSYQNGQPIYSLRKEKFTTLPFRYSGLTLDTVYMTGDTVHVVPSNTTDTYFYEFEQKSVIDGKFLGCQSYWFSEVIQMYISYELMGTDLSKGESTDVLSDYFYWKEPYTENDTITLMSVSFDSISGETAYAFEAYWLIHEGTKGINKVERATTDGLEHVLCNPYEEPTRKKHTYKTSILNTKSHYLPKNLYY